MSPDIFDGYAKNRNARAKSAGFTIFIPVPPNASFPIKTANAVATPSIQRGISTGTIRGISMPVTKNPSLISCPRMYTKINSTPSPTPYETTISGSTLRNP